MKLTISIPDNSSNKATALIQFLQSLDFITVTQEDKKKDTILDENKYITKSMITQADKEMEDYKKDTTSGMDMGLFIKELEQEDDKL